MEQIIKRILDFQRFSPNKRLNAIISAAENRHRILDDEELSMISAAGSPDISNDLLEKKDERTDRSI